MNELRKYAKLDDLTKTLPILSSFEKELLSRRTKEKEVGWPPAL